MSENMERRQTRRISSILKTVAATDSPTQTFTRQPKRISFSQAHNVREFMTDENPTIFGNSYQEPRKGSSSNDGTSLEQCVTSVTSDQRTEHESISVASAPVIDLFADIEDASNTENVEMDVSFGDGQSSTKLFNQSMFIEKTTVTSATNCHLVNMSIVSNGNKRKTVETITVDKTVTDVTKSVKIRKMNDENLEPEGHNTILHHVSMNISRNPAPKPVINLDATRIYDADVDLSVTDDVVSDKKILTNPSAPKHLYSHIGEPKLFDKTSTATTDMTVDGQSISSISDTCQTFTDKTHIYGRNDTSARIEQTFAVRNPLQETDLKAWNEIKKQDGLDKNKDQESGMETDTPACQPMLGNSRNRMLEDLTISMDIRFKDRSYSPDLHSNYLTDEHGIEDLTICMDTNFKVELSDENVSDDGSMRKSFAPVLSSAQSTKDTSQQNVRQESISLPTVQSSTTLPDHKLGYDKENVFRDASVHLPASHLSHHNVYNATNKIPEDMTFCSVVESAETEVKSSNPDNRMDSLNKKSAVFDPSESKATTIEFSFNATEPLSSTKFVPSDKQLNFSDADLNVKTNSSSAMYNYCPSISVRHSQDFRSAVSQNNTDELLNLEPDKLKRRSDMKKLFLDVSQNASQDMLSETKMELVGNASSECLNMVKSTNEFHQPNILPNQPTTNVCSLTDKHSVAGEVPRDEKCGAVGGGSNEIRTEIKKEVSNKQRCRNCSNCRRSFDANNTSFVKIEQLGKVELNLHMLDQYKGLASITDVIEAHKQREASRDLENQLLEEENVVPPHIKILSEIKSKYTVEPESVYVSEPLTCFPVRMDIQYLMRNKMRTEYTQWKYFDNFYSMGAIIMRHEMIPSIKIHIKFDVSAPKKADQLNMPLLFTKVFVEECPTYLQRISPKNFLKHKEGLALLPLNLMTVISDSENIYRGLNGIDKNFKVVSEKVEEVETLTTKHDAFFKLDERQCSIEQTIFDIKNLIMQEYAIKLDKIETVGPRSVYFEPPCETTDEFKSLPTGLPFLRAFLVNPKSYLKPFLNR